MLTATLVSTNCDLCVSDISSSLSPIKQSYETLLVGVQCVRPVRHPIGPALTPWIILHAHPFSSLSLDFVELDSVKVGGQTSDSALVVVCKLTGYIVAIPVRKKGFDAV